MYPRRKSEYILPESSTRSHHQGGCYELSRNIKQSWYQQGACIKYQCHKCGKQAVIKAYGEKKNFWYCPDCKKSGHVISLVMDISQCDWETAKKTLEEKTCLTTGKITKELIYELEYDKYLENQGITEIAAKTLGIGKPKGKTMLSGAVAFTVTNDVKKIAY